MLSKRCIQNNRYELFNLFKLLMYWKIQLSWVNKVLFSLCSLTCCCRCMFPRAAAAAAALCRFCATQIHLHMWAAIRSSRDRPAAPQALSCWQATTRRDEPLEQKVLTRLPISSSSRRPKSLFPRVALCWLLILPFPDVYSGNVIVFKLPQLLFHRRHETRRNTYKYISLFSCLKKKVLNKSVFHR